MYANAHDANQPRGPSMSINISYEINFISLVLTNRFNVRVLCHTTVAFRRLLKGKTWIHRSTAARFSSRSLLSLINSIPYP